MYDILQVVIIAAELIHLVFGVFGVAIYRMYKGGGLLSSVLLCWGLCIVWAIVWCIVLPGVLASFSKDMVRLFPEAIGVPPIVLAGWFPCMIACAIAYGVIAKVRKEKKPQIL